MELADNHSPVCERFSHGRFVLLFKLQVINKGDFDKHLSILSFTLFLPLQNCSALAFLRTYYQKLLP